MPRKSSPSYGVFMVDIFASSVGIFILVSLLYLIVSAQATSSEAMVERFKELVKRDEIPIHNYQVPRRSDPLHDWGVRANHARAQQEALVLLMRDKVLLYHTMEMLTVKDLIDSTRLKRYYQKYNKGGRLFLEVHYNDAYHALYAKVQQSLPQSVRIWTHWAYNAGNINNPNPTAADSQAVDLARLNANGDQVGGMQENGFGSSTGQQDGTGAGEQDGTGDQQGTGEQQGSGGEGTQEGEGDGQQQVGGQQGEGSQGGATDGVGAIAVTEPEPAWPRKNTGEEATDDNGQPMPEGVQAEITEMLNQNLDAEQFIDSFLQRQEQRQKAPKKPGSYAKGGSSDGGSSEQPETAGWGAESADFKQDAPSGTANDAETSDDPPAVVDEEIQALAAEYIKKNVFLAIPLYSPIYNFMLDVQVPGYAPERYYLDAVQLKSRQAPEHQASASALDLIRGDQVAPVVATANASATPRWHQMKITKVQGVVNGTGGPQTGWLYGFMVGEVFMMPVHQNDIQSALRSGGRYWFKQPTRTDEAELFNPDPASVKVKKAKKAP